jgi:hypothetical protein
MQLIPIRGKQQQKTLERSQYSLNSIKIEIDNVKKDKMTKDYEL